MGVITNSGIIIQLDNNTNELRIFRNGQLLSSERKTIVDKSKWLKQVQTIVSTVKQEIPIHAVQISVRSAPGPRVGDSVVLADYNELASRGFVVNCDYKLSFDNGDVQNRTKTFITTSGIVFNHLYQAFRLMRDNILGGHGLL